MERCANELEPVVLQDLQEVHRVSGRQLYHLLCEGRAESVIQSAPRGNGWEAWKLLKDDTNRGLGVGSS